jgi:formylmethanofuran dehydrogenase subunit D
MSDLDAYMVVVNKLVQEETNSTPVSKPKQEPVQVTQTVTKTVDKSKAKPSPSKASPSKVKYTDEDILNMSDEDFQKLERKKLY